MKKIELTEKQKDFLKKIGIAAGSIIVAGGAFYIFNRSELGFKVKNFAIGLLQESIATKNNRLCHISMYGKKPYITESDLLKAMDAASEVIEPIIARVNSK